MRIVREEFDWIAQMAVTFKVEEYYEQEKHRPNGKKERKKRTRSH